MNNNLTYREAFTAQMVWGGVPTDTEWVRSSSLFNEGLKKFDNGEWKYFEKEIWKPVVGLERKYIVSSHGKIKSVSILLYNNFTKKTDVPKKEKTLKQYANKKGYLYVCLYDENIKRHHVTIHKAVCAAFNGDANGRDQVNHKDGDVTNNHYTNLEWSTNRENVTHAIRNKKTSSKYTGVTWDGVNNKWRAQIVINKKSHCLGRHNNEEDAGMAYTQMLEKHGLSNKYKKGNGIK